MTSACEWCGKPFRARRGGSPQRFCGAACRSAFWSALRRWGERAVASGILTLDTIKNGNPAACTPLPGTISPVTEPEEGDKQDALLDHLGAILESLTIDELAELPETVWALLEFIAGPDFQGAIGPVGINLSPANPLGPHGT